MHQQQTDAAAAALRRGPGGGGSLALVDEEDEAGGDGPVTRFIGSRPVLQYDERPLYDRLRGGNNLDTPGDDGGLRPIGDTRAQDEAGGGLGVLTPVPIVAGPGSGE